MKNAMMAVIKENGYYYDFDNNTLTMTKTFEKKSSIFGSNECDIILNMSNLFTNMKIELYNAPKKTNKAISYELMMKYILLMPEAVKKLQEMERIQLMSKSERSPYKYVQNWFKTTFPQYGEVIQFDENGNIVFREEASSEKVAANREEMNMAAN